MANGTLIPEMQGNSYEDMYSRGTNSTMKTQGGTFVPEMHQNAQGVDSLSGSVNGASTNREEAVVGFLYSVSRMGIGEYWPLHLGANIIGRAPGNNIQLKEQTVSDKHAVININKMRTTGELIASIRDEGSKNGLFLNEEELDYDNHPCKNGDVITVGSNYQLLLILINASMYGLKVAEDFQPVAEVKAEPITPFNSEDTYTRHKPKSDDGTVDLGGASPFIGGGTRVL